MGKYVFNVKMNCSGCSSAVSKALGKLEGLDEVNVDLAKQEVVVVSDSVDFQTVLEKIQKTGKEVLSSEEF